MHALTQRLKTGAAKVKRGPPWLHIVQAGKKKEASDATGKTAKQPLLPVEHPREKCATSPAVEGSGTRAQRGTME